MKTRISQRMVIVVGLSALLVNPVFAAFGDDTAGSALPPGTYPSSPSDSDSGKSKTTDSKKQPPKPSKHVKPSDTRKDTKDKPRSGS
jgi:hypothetical protein